MWQALPQMRYCAQVLGGSSCLACGSSNGKFGKSEVTACVGRRRARRRQLRILPLLGNIAAGSLDGGQNRSLRSVHLLDSASVQRTRAVLRDVVYSLTQFGGILPAYAEEETSEVAAESLRAEDDISIGDQADNPPSASPTVDDTVVNASVDSPPTSSGEEVVNGGTVIEAGSDNVPAGEEIVSGGTGYEASGLDNAPAGEELVSGGTGYEASGLDNVPAGEELASGGTGYEASGLDNAPAGEVTVSGGTGYEASGLDNALSGEEIVSGGTGYEASGLDTLPAGEEIVSGGTGYEASGLDNVPAGEELASGGTGYEASGLDNAPAGEETVSGGTGYEASGLDNASAGEELVSGGTGYEASGLDNVPAGEELASGGTGYEASGLDNAPAGEETVSGGTGYEASGLDNASAGEELASGGTGYEASGLDNVPADEQIVSGGTGYEASGLDNVPAGEEIVSGGTGYEASGLDNVPAGEELASGGTGYEASGLDNAPAGEETVSGGTGYAASGLDNASAGEEIVSGGTGYEASGLDTLPAGEEIVSGGTGYEASSLDNVPAGEEIVSGGTGYEASGMDNVPAGEEIVSGGTGYEASGLDQAAPSSVGVDSGSDTLVDTVVDKPRAWTLDYDDLVGGSGSGNEELNSGESSEDPFGAINDAFASAQDAVANSISNVKTFFENAIYGIVNPSKNPPSESGDVTLQTNANNAAESGFEGTGGNSFETNTDSAGESSFGRTGGNPFQEAVDSIRGFYEDTVSGVEQTAQNISDGITGSIQNTTDSVTDAIDSVQRNFQTSIDNTKAAAQAKAFDTFGVFYPGTAGNDALKVVVDFVKANVGAAAVTAEKYALQVYTSTKGNLPGETQDALNNAESTVSEYLKPVLSALEWVSVIFLQLFKAFGVDFDNPIYPAIAFSLAVSYLGVSYLTEQYGGYTGDLDPQTALKKLQNESDVALVDIRPQEERDGAGILDLRRGARFRNGSVEVVKVSPAIKKQVRNSRDIDYLVTAAIIRNLNIVKRNSKVILLDADGRQSKDLARALRKLGVQKQYRITGGFRAWVTAGLPIRGEGLLTPIAILKEETAAIVEDVKPTSGGVILVVLGLVAGGYAVYEWEKTLQLIGTFAIVQFISNKIESYQSVDEVKADVSNLRKPFVAVGGGIAWLISQFQPKKLQLATTPSTSAVQDKVLQAAAKHGPHVPEVDEQGEEPSKAAATEGLVNAVSETTTTT